MPTTGIASLSDVLPLLDMGGEDIMQLLSDLPKTPPAPVQPPAMPIVEEILKDLILKEDPRIKPIKEFIEEERPPTMTMPPIMETPPQTEVKLPDGTVIDLSDLMPQPEEERIPVDLPPDPIADGIFPGAEPKDLLPPDLIEDMESRDILGGLPTPEDLSFVPRHSEQDPITGEVLNNQPFGGETPPFAVDPIPDPITGDRYPVQPMMPLEILPAPETETALEPMMPPAPETETTPVQGMTMEQMQQMIADMQAQQQEQAVAKAIQEKEMAQNYMVPTSRMGYNPYLSGQYQSDPYGPSGVPNMGGITTIPVPDGYGIYNPVYGG